MSIGNIIYHLPYHIKNLVRQLERLYRKTRVSVPSKMKSNYENCAMANFLSKTLLNTNRK